MGRRIERALQIVSLLRALLVPKFDESPQDMLIESALQCGEALIPYRRRYQTGITMENGLEMLVLNSKNPRSLIYQLEQLEYHFTELPNTHGVLTRERKLLLEATTALKLSDVTNLAESNSAIRQQLDQLLARIQYLVGAAGKEISQRYFDHTQSPQLLVKNTEWQDHL